MNWRSHGHRECTTVLSRNIWKEEKFRTVSGREKEPGRERACKSKRKKEQLMENSKGSKKGVGQRE